MLPPFCHSHAQGERAFLSTKGIVTGALSFRRKETGVALLFCATKGMEGPVCSFRSIDLAIDLSILTYSCSKMSVGCLYL